VPEVDRRGARDRPRVPRQDGRQELVAPDLRQARDRVGREQAERLDGHLEHPVQDLGDVPALAG
jgi:hypothetical protein